MKRVKTKWICRIESTSKVEVEAGQKVGVGKVMATSKQREVVSYKMPMIGRDASLVGKVIEEGELVWKGGGMWPKKIFSPVGGKIVGFDELDNILIEKTSSTSKEVCSPVAALVSKVDKDKIVLEFEAIEFKGKGRTRGKVWGDISQVAVEKIADLNSGLAGKIVLVSGISAALLVKAEVVGVVGIVTREEESENIDQKIEMVVWSCAEKDWKDLKKLLASSKGEARGMINSLKGRLLVVVN